MKPIILITVYRRYREFLKSLENTEQFISDFKEKPEIVVIWASPVIGQLWFFQELIKEGRINHLLFREKHELDGVGPTTPLEALNLNKGLDFIKTNYRDEDIYIIGQASDIMVNEGIYKMLDGLMHNGEQAVLFFWQNGIARENAWHTNFFCVLPKKEYWPPICESWDADTLEVQWGKRLGDKNLPFYRNHNSRCLKFHECNLPPMELAYIPQKSNNSLEFSIMGYKSWFRRFKEFIRRLLWLQ